MNEKATDRPTELSRQFMDEGMIRWEAYVSGGQPNTDAAAKIYFVCLEDPFERPRWVTHTSRSVAEATRTLSEMSDTNLVEILQESQPLD